MSLFGGLDDGVVESIPTLIDEDLEDLFAGESLMLTLILMLMLMLMPMLSLSYFVDAREMTRSLNSRNLLLKTRSSSSDHATPCSLDGMLSKQCRMECRVTHEEALRKRPVRSRESETNVRPPSYSGRGFDMSYVCAL